MLDDPGGANNTMAINSEDLTSVFTQVETPQHKRSDAKTDQVDLYADTTSLNSSSVNDSSQSPQSKPVHLVPVGTLFSFADSKDWFLMVFGTLCAIGAGIGQPVQIILWGDMINDFNPVASHNSSLTTEERKQLNDSIMDNVNNVNKSALNFLIVGIAMFFGCFFQVTCFSITASRQAKKIRAAYMQAIVSKDIGWFDVNEPMQLASRVADSAVTIQEGIGRKIGDSINFGSMKRTTVIVAHRLSTIRNADIIVF